ncbi:ABC transporter permease [Neokomagataea tanensis]|uniref:ABC transporter permease n=1 Tax=Neokomagataea tanensis TaxID=661191 RepID=A0A4Y6V9Q7_9PROT|nr:MULTISPECIES: ABC transporter permease [Neokomagataea]QDH25095.1 ABC transporter permease [Neokomagataea tanensis]
MTKHSSHEPVQIFAPHQGFGYLRAAIEDVREGFRLFPLALTLGWMDIKLRYRGSVLGPFWLTLSTVVMIVAMGILYGYLLHAPLREYLPFLSLSLVVWGYFSSIINEASSIFVQNSALMHARRTPITLIALRFVIRQSLIALHNVVVVVAVFGLFRIIPHNLWIAVLGIFIIIFDSFFVSLLIGILGARFKDISPVSSALMQVLFFVTPIIWKPSLIYSGRQYLLLDPFYAPLELLRGPLLGEGVRYSFIGVAFLQAIVLSGVTCVLFSRMRARIAYWV